MRPWIDWLARVGVAGAWIMAAGCGGGDVPDPGSDSTAASDAAPEGGSAPPAPPVAAPAPAAAAGPMRGRPGMMANQKSQVPPADAASEAGEGDTATQPPAGENSPPAKTEGGSATAEMLQLATSGQGSSSSGASGGGDAAGGQTTPPGGPGGPMQGQGRPGGPGGPMAGMPGMMGRPGGGPGQPGGPPGGQQSGGPPQGQGQAGPPGASGGGYADQMARMMQGRQGGGGTAGGYPGAPGGSPMANQGRPGGPGGPGGPGMQGRMGFGGPGQQDNGRADTHSPDGAVRAFLNALRDKDRDRLAEATALRSQTEASTEKKKELFGKLVDMSIADAELDDLAKMLDGYQVAGENAAKSTKSLGVIIRKTQENGDFLSRTVTVRKEKKGWGVQDMSEAHLFKSMRMQPVRRNTTGGR
jgi:hypothetical protein